MINEGESSNLLIQQRRSSSNEREMRFSPRSKSTEARKVRFKSDAIEEEAPSELKLKMSAEKTSALRQRSQPNKRISGYDIEEEKAIGSHFSGVWQETNGEKTNFHDTGLMKGRDFVQKLIKQ